VKKQQILSRRTRVPREITALIALEITNLSFFNATSTVFLSMEDQVFPFWPISG